MDLISVQCVRKLAKKEPVYVIMIRTMNDDTADIPDSTNEAQDQCTVAMGEDKTKTPYLEQVQAILDDYSDIFP